MKNPYFLLVPVNRNIFLCWSLDTDNTCTLFTQKVICLFLFLLAGLHCSVWCMHFHSYITPVQVGDISFLACVCACLCLCLSVCVRVCER